MMGLFYYLYEFTPDRKREGKVIEVTKTKKSEVLLEEQPVVVEKKRAPLESDFQRDLRELTLLEQKVLLKGKDCKNKQKEIFSNYEYLDPSSDFYKDFEEATKIGLFFLSTIDRQESFEAYLKFSEVLGKDYPIDPLSFKSRLDSYEICIDSRMQNFVEAYIEGMALQIAKLEEGQEEARSFLGSRVLDILLGLQSKNRAVPDISRFNLLVINSLIRQKFVNQSYQNELNSLLNEVSEQELIMTNEFNAKTSKERNLTLLKDYLTVYKNVSEDVKALLERIIEQSSN